VLTGFVVLGFVVGCVGGGGWVCMILWSVVLFVLFLFFFSPPRVFAREISFLVSAKRKEPPR